MLTSISLLWYSLIESLDFSGQHLFLLFNIKDYLFSGSCCDSLEISGPGIPIFENSKVPDTYSFHSMYNEKPAYKAKSSEKYLFFVAESPARWVIDNILGKIVDDQGNPVSGFIGTGRIPCGSGMYLGRT